MHLRTPVLAATSLAMATVLLAGCTTNEPDVPEQEANFLRISWVSSEKPGIDAVVAAYQAEHPEVQIIVTVADTAQYQTTMRTELSSGTAADILFVWPGSGAAASIRQLEDGDFFLDLSDEEWVAEYPEYLADLSTANDKIVLMAPMATSFQPIYNQAVLDANGLIPPSQWSEMIPFCEAALDAGLTSAYAIGAAQVFQPVLPLYAIATDYIYGDGLDFDDELSSGETTFPENDGYVKGLENYQAMIDAGCWQPDATGTSLEDGFALVASGKSAGSFLLGSRQAQLAALAPDADFRIHRYSSDDDPDTNMMMVSAQGGAAVNASSPRSELARDFVNFLADNTEIYAGAHPGTIPTIADGYTTDDPNQLVILDALAEGQGLHFLNQLWPNGGPVESAFNTGIQGMYLGSATPEQVLEGAQAALEGR